MATARPSWGAGRRGATSRGARSAPSRPEGRKTCFIVALASSRRRSDAIINEIDPVGTGCGHGPATALATPGHRRYDPTLAGRTGWGIAVPGRTPKRLRRLSDAELADVVRTHQDYLLRRPGGVRAPLVNRHLSQLGRASCRERE